MRRSIISKLVTVALTVIITLAFTAGVLAFKDSRRVPPGTMVGDINISELTYTQAQARLAKALPLDQAQSLNLRQGDKTVPVTVQELEIAADIESTLEQVRDTNGLFTSVANRGGGTRQFSPIYKCNDKKLALVVAQAAATFDRAPVNARVYLDQETLKRASEVAGFKTDNLALSRLIIEHLQRGNLQDITVPGQKQQPAITAEQLEPVRDMLAVYVTSFTPEPVNRAININLSAQRVNNTLLLPDKTLSLNQIVGERTAANGFKPAPVYQNGKTVDDLGGGLCQLASTLYNAVVAADLKVTERQPHSYPVDYVEPGQDATVAWDQHDLKFINTTGSPVLVTARSQAGKLQVRIYGQAIDPGKEIKLVTQKKTIAPEVNIITNKRLTGGKQVIQQKGSPGYEAITYRVETKNGKEVSRTQVSTDTYQSRPWIIEVAPGQKPRPGAK
ncbi:MAG: VanW family protein [Methylocystaceae bacterium]